MGSRALLFLAGLAAATVIGGLAIRQAHQAERLGAELAALRTQQDQAGRLQKEHQRLQAAIDQFGDLRQLRRANGQASMVRNEIEKLKLQAHNLTLAEASKDHPAEPIWPKGATVLPADEWRDAGNDSPHSTLESVLWAARGGDVSRLASLIDFRPGDRERADQLLATLPPESRAQYANPEALVATLVAANLPTDYAAVAPFDEVGNAKSSVLRLRVEQAGGQQQDLTFMLHHGDAGWQLDVPGNTLASFAQQLKSKGP